MYGFKIVFVFIFHCPKLKKACRNDKPSKYETAVSRYELNQVVPPVNIINLIFHFANIIQNYYLTTLKLFFKTN